jgi:membrane protease YdiL (CAAX protease family)
MSLMAAFKAIAGVVFCFSLWFAVPAALLYPLALWAAKHTPISNDAVAQGYVIAVAILFLPTGILIDFLYRRLFRLRSSKGDLPNSENLN